MSVLAWQALSVLLLVTTAGLACLAYGNRAACVPESVARAARERRARDLGWRYDGTKDGDIRYRMFGTSPGGVAWELAYDSDHSSSSSQPKLVWTAATLKGEGLELHVGGRRQFEVLTGATLKKLTWFASELFGRFSVLVEDYNAFVQAARQAPGGSARFRQRFVVAAKDPQLAADMVDSQLERLILDWPPAMPKRFNPEQSVSAWLGREGLRVECRIDDPAMSVCEQLVRLGDCLADRLAGSRARGGMHTKADKRSTRSSPSS